MAPFPMMELLMIVGEEPGPQRIPPPIPEPFVIVNPSIIESGSSPVKNVTTVQVRFPSMVADPGPFLLFTVMAFPRKLIFSTYVPGLTMMVNPLSE